MLEHRASHPLHTLFTVFLSWKALILGITLASSLTGPAYDTSTTLALGRDEDTSASSLTTRLTRWDAIYFTSAAHIGRVYEQEYAFGSGLPALVALIAGIPRALGLVAPEDAGLEAAIGIVVAHVAHLGAVFALHELTRTLFDNGSRAKTGGTTTSQDLAFFAALVHIISPAGVFLSAGYQEAPFACYSFVGFLLLARAARIPDGTALSTGLQVSAGIAFGFATVFRSNGLLNGIPFAAECLRVVLTPLLAGKTPSPKQLTALIGPVVGGLLVASGSVLPQLAAYRRYCSGASEPRVWCGRTLPSIYTFVQEHYWGVGFLRYWTLSNLPLFLLAAPVLAMMVKSGIDIIRQPAWPYPSESHAKAPLPASSSSSKADSKSAAEASIDQADTTTARTRVLVVSIAASQVLIALLALASYHVQIITRLASGYPAWCWWLASCLISSDPGKKTLGDRIVVFGVMYALIQTALFACFLPPA